MRIYAHFTALLALLACVVSPAGARGLPTPPPEADLVPIVLLADLSSGQVLYARNADRRFIPASITKVMTLYTAFEMIDAGKLKPQQVLAYRPETFAQWQRKGSTMFLPQDARVSVDQLLRGIATVSANDGSIVLAEGAAGSVENWTALMNANARAIGMVNSHFGTPNGWPDEGRTFVSARDLVTLAQAMIERHPTLYRHYVGKPAMTYVGITQRNHDPLIGRVAGADGIKTGFTNQAGYGFLGSAQRGGRRLAVVVAGAEHYRDRDKAARAMIEWGFDAFERRLLLPEGKSIASAKVQDGTSRTVDLVAHGPIVATVPKGTDPEVVLMLHYDGPLRAPFAAGDKIAELEIAVAGMPPGRISLLAQRDVGEAGVFHRIVNSIMGLFV